MVIDQSSRFFMKYIYFVIEYSAMAHPNQRSVGKL